MSKKETQILIAVFPIDGEPHMKTIDNTLAGMQAVVEGRICLFPTRIEGVIGFCNDDSIGAYPLNIFSFPFGNPVCGPFVLVREYNTPHGYEHGSLNETQIAAIQSGPCWPKPPLTPDDDEWFALDILLIGDPSEN